MNALRLVHTARPLQETAVLAGWLALRILCKFCNCAFAFLTAGLTIQEKMELAAWLTSRALFGYGLTFVLSRARARVGLHKFAKEALLCLLESCTAAEAKQVNERTADIYSPYGLLS